MSKKDLFNGFEKEFIKVINSCEKKVDSGGVKLHILSLVFIKFLQENPLHPFNINENYNWNYITKSAVSLGGKIDKVINEIEKNNSDLNGLFENISFIDFDDERSNLDLFKLVTLIDRFDFVENSPQDYAKYIIDLFVNKFGIDAGYYFSPNKMGNLVIKLLNTKNGSLYDGTVGLGNFLIEQNKLSNSVELFGQEIDSSLVSLCKINLMLNGVYNFTIKNSDVIREPWLEKEELKLFDSVVMEPPFSLKDWGQEVANNDVYGRFKYGVPSAFYGDMAFVLHAISSLKKNGRAVLVVPHGVLMRSVADEKIRRHLVEEDLIETIISMPSNLYLGTGIPVAILIINKNKQNNRKGKIQFINAEDKYEKGNRMNYLREEDLDWILKLYIDFDEIEGHSRIVKFEEIKENDYNLQPTRYFVKMNISSGIFGTVKVNKSIYENSDFEKVLLGDIVSFSRGYGQTTNKNNNGNYKIVNISDIQNNTIDFDKLNDVFIENVKIAEKYVVKKGDILLSCRGTTNKIVVIPEIKENVVFSNNLLALTANEHFNPEYLKLFLESPIGLYYLEVLQRGTTIKVLNVSDLKNIPIPKIPLHMQNELVDRIKEANLEFETSIKTIEQKRLNKYSNVFAQMGVFDSFKNLNFNKKKGE